MRKGLSFKNGRRFARVEVQECERRIVPSGLAAGFGGRHPGVAHLIARLEHAAGTIRAHAASHPLRAEIQLARIERVLARLGVSTMPTEPPSPGPGNPPSPGSGNPSPPQPGDTGRPVLPPPTSPSSPPPSYQLTHEDFFLATVPLEPGPQTLAPGVSGQVRASDSSHGKFVDISQFHGWIAGILTSGPGAGDMFVEYNGNITDIGKPAGFATFDPVGINARGEVAINARTAAPADSHVLLYSDGTYTDIGKLSGSTGMRALGIDEAGNVAGTAYTVLINNGSPQYTNSQPFVFTGNALYNLNDLVQPGSGVRLTDVQRFGVTGPFYAGGSDAQGVGGLYLVTTTS